MHYNGSRYVGCPCGIDSPAYRTEAEAITAWNARQDEVREARIILLSEDHGAQTHGLFSTFEDALLHAKKDGAHPSAEWQFTGPDRAVFLDDRTFWTASREPVRAALSTKAPLSMEGLEG
jgi:hypothetical protein